MCRTSYLGFQSESIRQSLEAPIRLSPTPPALELRRNKTNDDKEGVTISEGVS